MMNTLEQQSVDAAFADIVLGIEELEDLQAPGFWNGFAVGSVFAGAVVAGIAIT